MFEKTFCSSPWFHLRLTYDGRFKTCRWSNDPISNKNISNTSLMQFYNSDEMKTLRSQLLNGRKPTGCKTCYYEEDFGKINGRLRQLLKSGISITDFDRTIRSTPHYENFLYSYKNAGTANYYPVDLQIDLGNTCNSSCIMCDPRASSQLQSKYKKLSLIEPTLFKMPANFTSWPRDKEVLNRLTEEIISIPNLKYIHFLGGETLYDESFYYICENLISSGKSKDIIVGTTTNGTIYDERVERLIKEFDQFHLGISIESTTPLNDYIRYPSKVSSVLSNIDKFVQLKTHSNLQISLRITPNIFSIYELDNLIEYMMEKNVMSESCNILYSPAYLKMELMPDDIRKETIEKFDNLIQKYQFTKKNILNIRDNNLIRSVISDITIDYKNFLENFKEPDNAEELRFELVKFLKAFEKIHNNSILDYAPRYEKFLRHYGY